MKKTTTSRPIINIDLLIDLMCSDNAMFRKRMYYGSKKSSIVNI